MNIETLLIRGLYGYINKDIEFNKDITLLVGINGSGKTSVLNLISWLIKPSLPNLCITQFSKLVLSFSFKDAKYKIVCKHLKSTFRYEVLSDKESFHPLTIGLKISPKDMNDEETLRSSLAFYESLKPDTKEQKIWDFIKSLPDPIIIGLDRNIYTEGNNKVYIEESTRGRAFRRSQAVVSSPLDNVKDIINTEYRKKKNTILNLTSGLKNHLMLSAFDRSIFLETVSTSVRHKLNLAQIETAEVRVKEYLIEFENSSFTENDHTTITKYFSQLKQITKEYQEKPNDDRVKLLFSLNANQFVKINKLLKAFEKFESDSTKALEQINAYLETLNLFLKDSSKKLLFKEDTSEITFNTLSRDGKVINEYRDIKYLSSGEQQILILFSYLAFNSQDGKLFIIDEPELSLHVKWQEDFLDSLEKITPKTTQVILATHSPVLVGKKKEKAKVLYPYNL